MKQLLLRFARITDSTSYLPQVDGLRFLAIFAVVVIMHITGYLNEKFFANKFIEEEYWQHIVTGGGGGVSLFFMISGFILSWPFARWYIRKEKPISLKRYYLRRLTRLEPPYLIALLIFFFAQVVVLEKYGFQQLLPHFLASAVYLHTFIYHSFSWILPVAWSLEVEVQFYILAPLLFLLFRIPHQKLRFGIYVILIIGNSLFWHNNWALPHLLKFLHYFLCGMLLADLYTSEIRLIRNEGLGTIAGFIGLLGFIFIPSTENTAYFLARFACMFLLFHTVLTNERMKSLFSLPGFVIIGGMCYSIYLLHFAIVSATGTLLIHYGIAISGSGSFIMMAFLMVLIVLFISAIYFIVVEKPFMRPFTWFYNTKRN